MNELDFDSLRIAFHRLERSAVLVHSTARRLAEKYPGGIYAAMDDEQAGTIRDMAERMEVIDKQLAPFFAVGVEHEQAEPGRTEC